MSIYYPFVNKEKQNLFVTKKYEWLVAMCVTRILLFPSGAMQYYPVMTRT